MKYELKSNKLILIIFDDRKEYFKYFCEIIKQNKLYDILLAGLVKRYFEDNDNRAKLKAVLMYLKVSRKEFKELLRGYGNDYGIIMMKFKMNAELREYKRNIIEKRRLKNAINK